MIKYGSLFVLIFSLVFLFNFFVVNTALSSVKEELTDDEEVGSTQLDNPLGDGVTFEIVVNRVVQAILGLTGVLALIAFIYGGVLWMVSRGDTGMIQKGKTMMIWAVLGIVIIFSSYTIIKFVFEALMGTAGTPTP